MDFIKDIWGFIRDRKKVLLIPSIVVLIVVGILVVFAGGSVAAPLIYTIF